MKYLSVHFILLVILVLILTILPLPSIFLWMRPDWALLLVLYLQLIIPSYFSIRLILVLGFCLDILLVSPLGQHSFALLLTTWIASNQSQQFRFFAIGQQMFYIGLCNITYELIIGFIDGLVGYYQHPLIMLTHASVGLLVWPWFRIFIEKSFYYIKGELR